MQTNILNIDDFSFSILNSLNQTFRTLVILCESSAKLNSIVKELSASLQLNPIDLGLLLSKAEIKLDSSEIENLIKSKTKTSLYNNKEFYLIHSIGILFEPILNLSVDDFLLSLSKRKPIVLLFCGSVINDKIHLYNSESDMVLSIKNKQINNI